jgi:hypothetical protein
MLKRVLCTALILLPASTATAQIEIGAHAGYTLTGGVDFAPIQGVDGNSYNNVTTTDSFSWGLTIGTRVRQGFGIGFLFDTQETSLEISGPLSTKNLGDMNVYNYHGVLSYDYSLPSNPSATAAFFFGLGATQFGGMTIPALTPNQPDREIDGSTEFSTTWGLSFKVRPNDGPMGIRFGVRWTPTYIKSDPEGWWCDPYWGCSTYADADYSHQWEFAGGLTYLLGGRR